MSYLSPEYKTEECKECFYVYDKSTAHSCLGQIRKDLTDCQDFFYQHNPTKACNHSFNFISLD